MSILLTKEERDKAWEDTFEEPISFDHKPTADEVFDLRLESVDKAQLKKLADWGNGYCEFQNKLRRECEHCWQVLLREIE